jgi:hypothetical protein
MKRDEEPRLPNPLVGRGIRSDVQIKEAMHPTTGIVPRIVDGLEDVGWAS